MSRALPAAYKIRSHLHKGGVIAYPTEFCYGLGCLPDNPRALQKILRLKKRAAQKGLISIGKDLKQLSRLLQRLPENDRRQLETVWPDAVTFLLPARRGTSALLRGHGRKKIGVRIPAHAGARRLCRIAHSALVSTSANHARCRPAKNPRDIRRIFGKKVLVVGGAVGKASAPSRIVDFYAGKILRG